MTSAVTSSVGGNYLALFNNFKEMLEALHLTIDRVAYEYANGALQKIDVRVTSDNKSYYKVVLAPGPTDDRMKTAFQKAY